MVEEFTRAFLEAIEMQAKEENEEYLGMTEEEYNLVKKSKAERSDTAMKRYIFSVSNTASFFSRYIMYRKLRLNS